VRIGRSEEARARVRRIADESEGLPWLRQVISAAMASATCASPASSQPCSRCRGGEAGSTRRPRVAVPSLPPRAFVTLAKLRHDIEQLDYLKRRGVFGEEIDPIIQAYRHTIARLAPRGGDGRYPLDDETRATIGDTYNRILHIRRTPRLREPFSPRWNRRRSSATTSRARSARGGRRFLVEEALDQVRHFCLESTVWSGIRLRARAARRVPL